MNVGRILYRTRQFWHGLRLTPAGSEIEHVRSVLNPAQFNLFFQLQPGEQSHSLAVFDKLSAAGECDPDLLVASLLHDTGKILYPLRLWERAWIVLGKALFPQLSKKWAVGDLKDLKKISFWKRAFVVAEQHPQWGADLAAPANSSSLAVSLIRRHQQTITMDGDLAIKDGSSTSGQDQVEFKGLENRLLLKLQAADDES
jgi:hypothetical protein